MCMWQEWRGSSISSKENKPKETKEAKEKKPKEDVAIDTLKCPKCKEHLLKKGNTAYGCSNYQQCGFKIPFVMLSKKLSEKNECSRRNLTYGHLAGEADTSTTAFTPKHMITFTLNSMIAFPLEAPTQPGSFLCI